MPTEAIYALIQACLIGGALGFGVFSLGRLQSRVSPDRARWFTLLWPAAFALGAIGAYLRILTEFPHVPPREATEAFILFVIPLAVLLDGIATQFTLRRWMRWTIWILGGLAAPALLLINRLHDLIIGASHWSPAQAGKHLLIMNACMIAGAFILGRALRSAPTEASLLKSPAKVPIDFSRLLLLALIPVMLLAGVTLLSSGSYRLGALALSSVMAPLAGAYLAMLTGSPQIPKNFGPMIFVLPLGSLIILGVELADLEPIHAMLLAFAAIAPGLIALPSFTSVLRKPWQALCAMVLLGVIPALAAAIRSTFVIARQP